MRPMKLFSNRIEIRTANPSSLFLAVWLMGALGLGAAVFKPQAQDAITPKNIAMDMVWAEGKFTEGPTLGPKGVIFFSDIGNRTMRFDPATGKTTVFRPESGKSNGLMMDRKGRLVACEGAHGGGRRVSLTTMDGKTRTLVDRWMGKRFNSPNDLAIDGKDRIYFTDPRYGGGDDRELDFEGIFLITGKNVVLATKDIQRPNGILVSLDGQHVFAADNHSDPQKNHHLVRFNVQKDGTLVNKKILFDFGPNRRGIDGMTMDTKGNLYATAGREKHAGIYVFSPAGEHLAFIPTPGPPTNCVFGGGKEKNVLYITAQAPPVKGGKRPWALFRTKLKTTGLHIYPSK